MEGNDADLQPGAAVATVESIAPQLGRLPLLDDEQLLTSIEELDRLEALVHAAKAGMIAESERRDAAIRLQLCSTATFLTRGQVRTNRQAVALVREAVLLDRFTLIGDACRQGRISCDQARGILAGLQKLPAELSSSDLRSAQERMIDFAEQFGPDDLRRLARVIWERLDPQGFEEAEAARLDAEQRSAEDNRRLSIVPDGMGSMIVAGQLPVADGEELRALVDAHAQSIWARCAEQPLGRQVPMTRAQTRADALILVVRRAATVGDAPRHGGDRPRISVLTSLEALRTGLGEARVECGELLSPTEVRRLACDADLLPITLDAAGVPLDVGRAQRLVTPSIRAALVARDQGCVFPGCDRAPGDCEAHHVQPWWFGGPTSLANLALLCPHHHRTVEPSRAGPWDRDDPHRWAIRIVAGIPTIIPPTAFDPVRRPRRHARFRMRHAP